MIARALALAALFLTACGPVRPTLAEGRFVTTQHGTARFADAIQGARDYCAAQGLSVKHLGTDTPMGAQSISRFECVKP